MDRALSRLGRRKEQPAPAPAGGEPKNAPGDEQPGEEPDPSKYAGLWNPSTELEALRQIYNTESVESFEEGGQQDFSRLEPHIPPGSTVLDLGCGIGRVAKYVIPHCALFWAVDVSQQMLDMARARLGDPANVRYARCQDTVFPDVPSASVDLAYSLLVLQHTEREDAFLLVEELHRVVKPGGTIVVTYPNFLSDEYCRCFVNYAHSGAVVEKARARVYTPQEVERLMGAAGFVLDSLDAGTEIRVTAHRATAD